MTPDRLLSLYRQKAGQEEALRRLNASIRAEEERVSKALGYGCRLSGPQLQSAIERERAA